MSKTKGFLLAVGIVLAMAFTLSCSSDEGEGGGSSSSYGGGDLSSNSSAGGVVYGTSVTYDNDTYPTVVIGSQTWFAKNLNYNPNSGSSACYENEDSNCAVYGRLYDWATAMGLPSSCNSAYCSSQIQSKHRGICPVGWHIPSYTDWGILVYYAGGDKIAGKKLKAKNGWDDYRGASGNGTDEFGFSALPGGYGDSVGNFSDVGESGFWWNDEHEGGSGNAAYFRPMSYDRDYAYLNIDYKSYLFSVRCVQD